MKKFNEKRNVKQGKRGILTLFLIAVLCSIQMLSAVNVYGQQPVTVSGTVTDAQGQPLPGVTVVEEGTTNGTVTNNYGVYAINVPGSATLIFSFVGMKTQRVGVGNQTKIDIRLEEETIGIDEVVAVGYGTVRRSDLTGSVSSVRAEELQRMTISSFDQAIQGKAAGVLATSVSSAPGAGVSVRIRGISSINSSNDPLYVIDGVPFMFTGVNAGLEGMSERVRPNPFSFLNPGDIESIEILKDASATAIYGSRGANGVILISTKSGANKPIQISYEASYGLSKVDKLYKMATADQHIEWVNEWASLEGRPPLYPFEGGPSLDWYSNNSTDWQSTIMQVAPTMKHDISVLGGTDIIRFAVSGGVLQQEGIVKGSSFDRYSLRVNLDFNVSPKFLISSRTSLGKSYQADVVAERDLARLSPMASAWNYRPTTPVYKENGSYAFDWNYGPTELQARTNAESNSPVNIINEQRNTLVTNSIISTLFGEYEIIDNLKLKVSGSISTNLGYREQYGTKETQIRYYGYGVGFAHMFNNEITNLLNENTLAYNTILEDKHRINAVIGYTIQTETRQSRGFRNGGFISDVLEVYNLENGSFGIIGSLSKSTWQMASYFSRVNYVYDDRFLVTATVRADGSSKFGTNNKWGVFPSAAVAWTVSNEKFMEDNSTISNLKLRTSWGITGNQEIPPYLSQSRMESGRWTYPFGGTAMTGFILTSMSNEDLRWEQSTQFNLGLDLSLLENRLTFSADYYKTVTNDLLLSTPLPRSSGFGSTMSNVGSVENKGMDFTLEGNVIRSSNFTWRINTNFSFYRNKVTELGDVTMVSTSLREGYPLGMHYGSIVAGVFADAEDVNNWENGIQAKYGSKPGNYKFYDINEDGKIDGNDAVYLGSPHPDFIYGLTNNMSYKRLTLNLFFQGTYGNYLHNQSWGELYHNSIQNNVAAERIEQRWTPENPYNAKYSGWTKGIEPVGVGTSTLNVSDGSYLRLKTVTLSYNLPVERITWLKNLQVFATAENLFTITKYEGLNPDVDSQAQSGGLGSFNQMGIDRYAYPLAKTLTLGIKVGF